MTQYDPNAAASITALAQRIMGTNLCQEIMLTADYDSCTLTEMTFNISFQPKYKYQFSRAKWYVAEYDWVNYGEVMAWCAEQFGPHPRQHDAWSRWWDRYEGKVHFRDQKDYQWFILRWGA